MRRMLPPEWTAKTIRLNANHTLAVGERVTDVLRRSGRVVSITLPHGPGDVEDHGTVAVALDDGEEEHYCWFGWQRILRRLES